MKKITARIASVAALALLACFFVAAATDEAAKHLQLWIKLYGPPVRYLGMVRYDLEPLIRWLIMDKELQKRFTRPQALQYWEEMHDLNVHYKTNGWSIIKRMGRPDKWIALRNCPQELKPRVLVFRLQTQVTLPLGNTFITAFAYDFGTTNPPPVRRAK